MIFGASFASKGVIAVRLWREFLTCCPHPPAPSHAYTFLKEEAVLAREGEFFFQNIDFITGLRSRLPPRSVLGGAHRAPGPPSPRKGTLSLRPTAKKVSKGRDGGLAEPGRGAVFGE